MLISSRPRFGRRVRRSRRPGSLDKPDLVGCRVARSHQPDISLRFPRPQARDCRVVVYVDFVIAGLDINGDELAIVVGTKRRSDFLVEDRSTEARELIEGAF